ncbi:hypothetical protein SLEP1_g4735 [Rubroshorea leprosula]|uniref:Uncharacterized protein n=1 Tax=Rubroshorea leprosula TaxID=152421 RepID=A0AAV5HYJ9_9ROSI|nr:hypothetical protein SLEP1_g4735 [Rubroshorea leprosula]
MSSKETVSVVGSEVMPLEYGGIDSDSRPSSSERTMEGVGGGEVVGVGVDSVPITVVEVEGRKERCYDVDADIVDEKAKRANQNKFSLNEDEEEEVGKLVREGGNLINITYLTNAECIEVAELYGPSTLSEVEMDKFFSVAKGVAIPKKPRKKSKTSTKRGTTEEENGGGGRGEEEERGSEVPQFVPQPPPVELDPELREFEEGAEVRVPGKGKGLVPPLSFQSSLFEAKNMTGARRFINATFPEVDKRYARDKALRYCGASVVKHVLERELGEWSSPGVYGECEGALPLAKACKAQEKEIRLTKEAYMELKKNVQLLVHNGMEERISNFVSSSSFDSIVNLYRLPTAILAFTDCRKKVKAEYPEVDITKITFGEQEEGVEKNDESMSADFCPQIKLRWDHDADGRIVFPPNFDFKFVTVEEEEAEVEGDEVGAGVEGTEVDESQPALEVEIHPVPSDDEQPPLPDEQPPTQPPLPAEQQPVQSPPSTEE